MLRAMTIEVVFEALPPWTDIPPALGPFRPNNAARARVVCFSISVRGGDTW